MDAIQPTHTVMQAYGGIRKETEKEVRSNTGRQKLDINRVYSPLDQEIIIREDKRINFDSTMELFKTLEQKQVVGYK